MRDGVMSAIPAVNTSRLLDPRLKVGAMAISEALRAEGLRYFLRIVSVGSLAAYIPWIALILLDAPILQPDGALAPMLRFQPYNADYEGMLVAINVVWAIMLWRASNDPVKHSLFIDFTIWGYAAHGFVMIIVTPAQKGVPMAFIEAFPLFVIAAVLWWLRPGTFSQTDPASCERSD